MTVNCEIPSIEDSLSNLKQRNGLLNQEAVDAWNRNRDRAVNIVKSLVAISKKLESDIDFGSRFELALEGVQLPTGYGELAVSRGKIIIELRFYYPKRLNGQLSVLPFRFDASGHSDNSDLTPESINKAVCEWIDTFPN